ncbi:MAG: Uma2 family endonuclease [Pyrinomonadaceae bacterium]
MIAVEETIEEIINETPTLNHSYICSQIMRQLLPNEDLEVLPELTLAIGNGLTPDVSVYPKEQIKPNFWKDITLFEQPPLVAVEVVSPSQNIQDLLEKAQLLVQSGVKTVWTVEPFSRSIWVTNDRGTQLFHDTIVESEGVKVDFQKIFASDISLSA